MSTYQYCLDLSTAIRTPEKRPQYPSWRIQAIAQRHSLPMAQASIYAQEMGLPVGEVRK